jgi:hypothetical protein
MDLSKYPTLRKLAAHNRAHVHERLGDPCSYCDMDNELRSLLAAVEEHAREAGIDLARRVLTDLANWSFNGTNFNHCPSNVLDTAGKLLLDIQIGAVTPRKRGT